MKSDVRIHKVVTSNEINIMRKLCRENISEEDVFAFTIRVCDNAIDKDAERLSVSALYQIAEMLYGKTGIISDKSIYDKDVVARIYQANVCCDYNKKTIIGEDYQYVEAKAFIIYNDNTKTICKMIQSEQIQEVSIGCAVATHKKRVSPDYGEYTELRDVTEVYEWAFVTPTKMSNEEYNYNEYDRGWNDGYKKGVQDSINRIKGLDNTKEYKQ